MADAPSFAVEFDRRSRSVSADLDAIFREAPPPRSSEAAPPKVRLIGRAPSRAVRTSMASLGALAAVGLLGLAVGAALTRPPGPPRPPPVASQSVVAQAAPAPAPAAVAAAPTTPSAPVLRARQPAPAPPAVQRPARAKAPPAARAARGCQALRGEARARCAYPAVLAADRRLRTAYARATRAGVSRTTLITYRSRWASLGRRATAEPARVIAGYGVMAGELDRLARNARASS